MCSSVLCLQSRSNSWVGTVEFWASVIRMLMDLSSRELWRVPKVHGSWDSAVQGHRSFRIVFWCRASAARRCFEGPDEATPDSRSRLQALTTSSEAFWSPAMPWARSRWTSRRGGPSRPPLSRLAALGAQPEAPVRGLPWQRGTDGHCNLSPDNNWILTDTYPDAYQLKKAPALRQKEERGERADLSPVACAGCVLRVLHVSCL